MTVNLSRMLSCNTYKSTTGLSNYPFWLKILQATVKSISSAGVCSCLLSFSMSWDLTLGFFLMERSCSAMVDFPRMSSASAPLIRRHWQLLYQPAPQNAQGSQSPLLAYISGSSSWRCRLPTRWGRGASLFPRVRYWARSLVPHYPLPALSDVERVG